MSVEKKLGSAELLFQSAQKMGLEPSWIVPRGVFAVQFAGTEKYVNLSHSPINSHVAASLARNKRLTRLILERHGMQNISFLHTKTFEAAATFLALHEKIIAKPVQGSGSRDIHIVTNVAQLHALTIQHYILEKYVTGTEMRYLVLNNSVIAVHRCEYGVSVEEDRYLERFSISGNNWDADLVASSIKIANILGLNFGAIDYLVDAYGVSHILEVNSAPGLKWFHAPTAGPAVDVATPFLQTMLGNSIPQLNVSTDDNIPNWYTQLA